MKKNVFITVDVEHSVGGAFENPGFLPVGNEKRIFGNLNGVEYGIPLIIDIAGRYGLSLTFFVEVLNHYFFGKKETRVVCEYLQNKNQDIQLHIHPIFKNFKMDRPDDKVFSDLTRRYDLKGQIDLINHSKQVLNEHGVEHPVAFRAGGYAASDQTLAALKQSGFLIDSSFSRAFKETCCRFSDEHINDKKRINGIWEFPITNFIENTHLRSKRYMPLDINGVGFGEMRYLLENTEPANFTIILHSFSFIQAKDVQYRKVKLRRVAIRRFKKLCRYLASNPDKYHVTTFGKIAENQDELNRMGSENHIYPQMPVFLSICRAMEQVYDSI
jgi:hypothetical protein